MSEPLRLILAYVVFLVVISICWVPLRGREEAVERLKLLPVYWLCTTLVAVLFALIVWLVLPQEMHT